jgi:hypothetical protein
MNNEFSAGEKYRNALTPGFFVICVQRRTQFRLGKIVFIELSVGGIYNAMGCKLMICMQINYLSQNVVIGPFRLE